MTIDARADVRVGVRMGGGERAREARRMRPWGDAHGGCSGAWRPPPRCLPATPLIKGEWGGGVGHAADRRRSGRVWAAAGGGGGLVVVAALRWAAPPSPMMGGWAAAPARGRLTRRIAAARGRALCCLFVCVC